MSEETTKEATEKKEVVVTEVGEEVYTGTVIWFNYKTGFGYIHPDNKEINDGKDVFVHYKGISDNLAFVKEGKAPFKKLLRDQKVKFNLAKNARGFIAVNVDKADEGGSAEG